MKFVIFVESHTEKKTLPAFLKRWLDPQLARPVGIQAVRSDGWQEFVKKVPVKARLHLEGPQKNDIIAAVGLLDLYGPTFHPSDSSSADQRFRWAKNHLEGRVNHPKFRMFFAVHELEAWLLSQPELLPAVVTQALPGTAKDPESLNFDCPPARLLDRIYQQKLGRSYRKTVDGTNLFDQLSPADVYAKCPYFKEMLDEMCRLARGAGL